MPLVTACFLLWLAAFIFAVGTLLKCQNLKLRTTLIASLLFSCVLTIAVTGPVVYNATYPNKEQTNDQHKQSESTRCQGSIYGSELSKDPR